MLLIADFYAGWTVSGWRWEVRADAMRSQYEQAVSGAQKAVTAALEKARVAEARGAELAQEQIAREAYYQKHGKERDDALRKLTSGRRCLGGAARRLLNAARPAAGDRGLPAPADGVARPVATVAPHSIDEGGDDSASDTDVALWARFARDQYDLCRGRIDAIRIAIEVKP
jgi:hypothetical protein